MSETALALTDEERRLLSECEETIQHGLETFYAVGNALATVRDRRLYRETHATFEVYCQERWEMSKTHAYRLIGSAEVVENLKVSPETPRAKCHPLGDKSVRCDTSGITPSKSEALPQNERQARPLARLEPEEQREAWAEISQQPEPVTARVVERVVTLRERIREGIAGTPVERQPDATRLLESYYRQRGDDFFQTVLDFVQTGDYDTVQKAFLETRRNWEGAEALERQAHASEAKTFTISTPMPLSIVPDEDDTRPFPIRSGNWRGAYVRASTIPWWLAVEACGDALHPPGCGDVPPVGHLRRAEQIAATGGLGREEMLAMLRGEELE